MMVMMATSDPSPRHLPSAPATSPAAAALADLYRSEARLLTELTRVLERQQEALVADDLDALDDTVFATHRILGTLGEARRQRRAVHVMLSGVEELDSAEIDRLLDGNVPDGLSEARALLRAAASALREQVRASRLQLERAVASGEALIRSVYGGTSTTHPFGTATPEPSGGRLLDRIA